MGKKYFLIDTSDDLESFYENGICIIESKTKKYKIKQVLHSNTFIVNNDDNFAEINGYLELEEF